MLEKLLELDDIRLLPSAMNSGMINKDKYNFGLVDEIDRSVSLPIFANSSVVTKDNWKDFSRVGMKPILPIEENLNLRLEGCEYIFAPFTLQEIKNNFLSKKRMGGNVFRIYIYNNGDGHFTEVLNIASGLRKTYGPQVDIAAGNIVNARTYEEYCKAGINYAFVGMGESIDDVNGFYYPIASLLIELCGKRSMPAALKNTKIVASGYLYQQSDILKAIALGADYVLVGEPLAKVVEASGSIFKVDKGTQQNNRVEVNKGTLLGMSDIDLQSMELKRFYHNELMTGGKDVRVSTTLDSWMKDLYGVFSYGFTMTDSLTWESFHKNIKYGKI